MAMYVAFLKGINLGRRRVKNDALCECFSEMGFADVSALLASGNIMFDSRVRSARKLESTIEKGLEQRLSYEVRTFVREAEEVVAIAAKRPFDDASMAGSTGKVQVAILGGLPSASNRTAALRLATSDDRLCLEGTELFWLPKSNMSASELDLDAVAAVLGVMTMRTQRTLARLAAKLRA